MFNKETFSKMKKKPWIINEGRGPMICEEDLVWALDNGLVRGAGIDMLESENPDLSECSSWARQRPHHAPLRLLFGHLRLPRQQALDGDGINYFLGNYDKVSVVRNEVKR